MSDPVKFLNSFAHALAGMTLYATGHPARDRAIDAAYRELLDLQADTARPLFTFLGDEIVYGRMPLRELKAWDWAARLAQAGIQRLEFEDKVTREEFEGFLDDVLARLTLSMIDTTEAHQMRRSSIRYGAVGVKGDGEKPAPVADANVRFALSEEVEAIRWCHEETKSGGRVHVPEAEAVVRSLSLAMHGGRNIVIPLLQLKEFDQYTTTHSMNVAVLSMALAEYQGFDGADVRGLGVAGLLHDIGKVRIPLDVLTKPGAFTAEERAIMNQHPVEGARIILQSEEQLDVAAVVAYEHHIMLDGGGYPTFRVRRDCHYASKLVHVCDVYDALRTRRPYREAWSFEKTLGYLEERSGLEFDPTLCGAFTRMMRQWEPQVALLTDPDAPVTPAPPLAAANPHQARV